MLPPVTPEVLAVLTPPERTATLLNYMVRCPAVRFQGYRLQGAGRARGFFLLSSVGPQTRIADLFVNSTEPVEWTAAYALAGRVAQDQPETCEIAAVASTPVARQALSANGFRPCGSDPAWVSDPGQLLDAATPLHVTMLEWDGGYLYNPENPFLS